jgi:H+/gluconate symporter-like permease
MIEFLNSPIGPEAAAIVRVCGAIFVAIMVVIIIGYAYTNLWLKRDKKPRKRKWE